MLEPGWLERQFRDAERERERWPEWLKRARELRDLEAIVSTDSTREPIARPTESAPLVHSEGLAVMD